MKLLILGGTSDTRKYIETCAEDYIITVATQYGFDTFSIDFPEHTRLIRFTSESLERFIADNGINRIIDTTHPFASEITSVATETAKRLGIPYENHMRDIGDVRAYERSVTVETFKQAAEYLENSAFSSIFLTTGSNSVDVFSKIADRSYIRVLPYEKSIEKCRAAGFEYKRIIAMQGPFSAEFNEAMMKEIKTDVLVTKMSGDSGGLNDKIISCEKTGAVCVIITGGF